ncbi:MAG: deoxyguanosinetriphosphate triphosphohydrolase [Candidatus Calescibacterium sp.]|nr:deoxyguanosinetriphosphate triphosphohydrolase [Candidatus Calescibacterium sp.]
MSFPENQKPLRVQTEEIEEKFLSPIAQKSRGAGRRKIPEEPCSIRTCFQVDRDRILHSKAFRRLKRKTQVLILPKGDHYRTRLTHTLEVMQIARTIARALRLNEDLTEAIALGHDLGHTPFGHAGEFAMRKIIPNFHHAKQSVRVVEKIEKNGKGLNLTLEVIDGILKHSKGMGDIFPQNPEFLPITAEGKVVRISDIIAYLNHDLDDAFRAGLLEMKDVPQNIKKIIGEKYGERIDNMVKDVIYESLKKGDISISSTMLRAMEELRDFLNEKVYRSPEVMNETKKVERIILDLYEYYIKNPDHFERDSDGFLVSEKFEERVIDFIVGMTDRFAMEKWLSIFAIKSVF